jgi:2,4-dienoyl-CoA reductase-like NADH-dependent reductase (Old Yellow Enzyme family)
MRLFDPVTLGKLKLANRTVMAPMTRSMSPGGTPGEDVVGYYARRALGGVGLIITEGLRIDHPGSVHDAAVPNFFAPEALAVWARIAMDVQAAGAAFVPQLWHVGGYPDKNSPPGIGSVSPSGVYQPGSVLGTPATQREIDDVIAAYATAATAALAIGCDGIELHGAHGYLLDQFFWAETNARSDVYGGDLAARTRFACEVVAACRRATAADFQIFLRFSQWKLQDYGARLCATPADLERFLAPLVDAGVTVFDCSTRRFWIPEFDGSEMNLAGWTQKLSGRPAMTVGSVGLENDVVNALHEGASSGFSSNLDLLETMLARGDFELVGIGRALLGDAFWVDKVRRGAFAELKGFDKADLLALK